MKRLLAIELQKIWKNKASRVLTIAYFVLLSFIALIASIKFDLGIFKLDLAEMGIFNFPYINKRKNRKEKERVVYAVN